jgi:DNA-binding beta-propeller fold protein YncE
VSLTRTCGTLLAVIIAFGCVKDKGIPIDRTGYPEHIAKILVTSCATRGCHTAASREAAGGLSLETWRGLFEGGASGAVVVPFSPGASTLLYYTNTDASRGPALLPTMPLNGSQLSDDEFLALQKWITTGAPDRTGVLRFRENAESEKIYVANRLCDLVYVIDGVTGLQMGCVETGTLPKTEFPACLQVTPDRRHWLCTSLTSTLLRKFSAADDLHQKDADLGNGVWESLVISADSKLAFCADKSSPGKISVVDLETMGIVRTAESPELIYPTSMINDRNDTVAYTGTETGNFITRIDFGGENLKLRRIAIDGSGSPSSHSSLNPLVLVQHTVTGTVYAGCAGSNELIGINPQNEQVVANVKLPGPPTCMVIDHTRARLFVSMMSDSLTFPGHTGSLAVIDLATHRIEKNIKAGYQSSGLALLSAHGYLAVVNSNISPKGPLPHHTGNCSGRNGYLSFLNLSDIKLIDGKRVELAVYPFAAASR